MYDGTVLERINYSYILPKKSYVLRLKLQFLRAAVLSWCRRNQTERQDF